MPISPSTFRRATQSPFHREPRRVPGVGPKPARCMLIAEKPGEAEAFHRPLPEPMVGPAGRVLNLCLDAADIDRSTLFIVNCVREFTSYSKPTREELERDKPELVQDIIECSPEIIGLVGGYAVEWVLGRPKAEMEKVHGVPLHVDKLFGGEVDWSGVVLPILHPAGATHSPDSLPMILDDVITLGKLLDGEMGVVVDEVGGDVDYRVVTVSDLEDILR